MMFSKTIELVLVAMMAVWASFVAPSVDALHWRQQQERVANVLNVDVQSLEDQMDSLGVENVVSRMAKEDEEYFEATKKYVQEAEQYWKAVNEPPPHEKAAQVARYIMHNSEWGALATLSTQPGLKSFPFANVFSVSDGADLRVASGIPYFYLTPMDMSVKDLYLDNRASLTLSLAEGNYCSRHHYDPKDPRCAHLILTGTVERVEFDSDEENFARNALFSRHPEMAEWPVDHEWFFGKMNVSSVIVLDYFGGARHVAVTDYFRALPTFLTQL